PADTNLHPEDAEDPLRKTLCFSRLSLSGTRIMWQPADPPEGDAA
ncbi:hypothetical protein ABH924_003258, partial [Arthrobacter sp. GAS37]